MVLSLAPFLKSGKFKLGKIFELWNKKLIQAFYVIDHFINYISSGPSKYLLVQQICCILFEFIIIWYFSTLWRNTRSKKSFGMILQSYIHVKEITFLHSTFWHNAKIDFHIFLLFLFREKKAQINLIPSKSAQIRYLAIKN